MSPFQGAPQEEAISRGFKKVSIISDFDFCQEVELIIKDAVNIERSFVCDAIPVELIGMNAKLMTQYIEFVADRLMVALGYKKIYGIENPFEWMVCRVFSLF